MPRYYFHVMDGRVLIDTEGTELASLEAVHEEALRAAGGILADMDAHALAKAAWTMTVADGAGKAVYSLRFEATQYE